MKWPTLVLQDLFSIERGGSPRPIDAYVTDDPNGTNWITITDASANSKYITRTKRRIRPEGVARSRLVKPGDFLLTNSMSFGRPYIMRTQGCIHDGWLVLTPREQNVDHDFFYHLLGSDRIYGEFKRLAAGATVKNLNIELVRKVKVPLPPLAEQQRIAAILDQAEALQAKRRQALAKLDTLTQSLFLEMFGKEPQNGDFLHRLEDVCVRITDGTHQPPEWSSIGHPFLFVSNIRNGQIDFCTEKFISEDTYLELTKNKPIEKNDILYTTVGSYGNAALVRDDRKFCFQRHIAHLKPNSDLIEPEFLASALNTTFVRRQADRCVKGVAQKTLNLFELRSILVPVPQVDIQREFVRIIKRIGDTSREIIKCQTIFERLSSSLQHQAFQGLL